jgi:hypothetical protein
MIATSFPDRGGSVLETSGALDRLSCVNMCCPQIDAVQTPPRSQLDATGATPPTPGVSKGVLLWIGAVNDNRQMTAGADPERATNPSYCGKRVHQIW